MERVAAILELSVFKIRVHEVKHSLLAGGSSDKIKTWGAQGQMSRTKKMSSGHTGFSGFSARLILPAQFQLKCHILKWAQKEPKEAGRFFTVLGSGHVEHRGVTPIPSSHWNGQPSVCVQALLLCCEVMH